MNQLASDLEKAGAPHHLVRDAEKGRFGDFYDGHDALAFPKMTLVDRCKLLGLDDIAKDVMAGKYDE